MRILFMGTPEFAKINLSALYESGEEIIGVVTTPDKAKGRGMVLTPSDVKKYALEKNLDIYVLSDFILICYPHQYPEIQ